jgi:hypothetical protein
VRMELLLEEPPKHQIGKLSRHDHPRAEQKQEGHPLRGGAIDWRYHLNCYALVLCDRAFAIQHCMLSSQRERSCCVCSMRRHCPHWSLCWGYPARAREVAAQSGVHQDAHGYCIIACQLEGDDGEQKDEGQDEVQEIPYRRERGACLGALGAGPKGGSKIKAEIAEGRFQLCRQGQLTGHLAYF